MQSWTCGGHRTTLKHENVDPFLADPYPWGIVVTTSPDEVVARLNRAGVTAGAGATRRPAEYSTDASLYRVLPAVVVFPRHADEMQAIVDVSRTAGIPVTARGAGTSIAGNAVGPGIVVDFSRHLRRIRSIDEEAATAVVEP